MPSVDRAAMVEVDRIMEEDLGIGLIQMMENAGRSLARLAAIGATPTTRFLALAGRGGNGGGALTAARRLAGWGYPVSVYVSAPPAAFSGVPARQLATIEALSVPVLDQLPADPDAFDVLLDGLVGYALNGALRGVAAEAVGFINRRRTARCISLDVPSGFYAARGSVAEVSVRPDAILTIAALKRGLPEAYADMPLYLADISVPASVFARVGAAPFAPPADLTRLV